MHQLHRWWKWKTWMAEIGTRTRVIRVRMILRSAIQRTKWLHWFHFFWFAQLDLQSHAKVPTCSVLRSCSNSFQLPVAGAYWLLWISVHVQLGCKHTHMSNTWQYICTVYICIRIAVCPFVAMIGMYTPLNGSFQVFVRLSHQTAARFLPLLYFDLVADESCVRSRGAEDLMSHQK